ncbi:hypothetical protein [Nostoc sp.]
MRSFQFITPRGDGKIERSCQCDRTCDDAVDVGDVYDGLFGIAL